MIDIKTGLLLAARQVTSPNYNQRPPETNIDLLVIHNISLPPNEFGGQWIEALFTNTLNPNAHPYFKEIYQLQVSAHLLIRRDGDVVQFVPFHLRAWHAGKSRFQGKDNCNDFSIGIELEGADNITYTDNQYQKLNQIINALQQVYPQITPERIVGHSDIAPRRKTDPGSAFDWQRLLFR